MYEEKRINFDWKGFLLKLAFVIVVFILVLKLLPLNSKNNKTTELSAQFKNNMSLLKDAGSNYFTKEKIPANIGEEIKVSLTELIQIGGVKALKTKNKACDGGKSFIKAIKNATDYELEVNLICSEESDKTVVYLGCFDLCTSTTTTTTTSKKTTVATTKSNNYVTNNTTKNVTTQVSTTTKKITTTTQASYAVIFNTSGGTLVNTIHVLPGTLATRPSNPARSGYIFTGWYYNGNLYNFDTPVRSNQILIAKWLPNTTTTIQTKYTVTFNSNGGTVKPSQMVKAGELVTKPENPTKANATFIGWYHNGLLFNFATKIYGNITLVAKYRETEIYTKDVYTASSGIQTSTFQETRVLAIPNNLRDNNITNPRIKSLTFLRSLSTASDLYYKYNNNDFEPVTGYSDYQAGIPANLAYISGATISKTNSAVNSREVSWTGIVGANCIAPFNHNGMINACMYGITYRVVWEYEIER